MDNKELFVLMGKISNTARRIIGGHGINAYTEACNIYEIKEHAGLLKAYLDEYDTEMIRRTRENHHVEG